LLAVERRACAAATGRVGNVTSRRGMRAVADALCVKINAAMPAIP
jgi:hypothetical protein